MNKYLKFALMMATSFVIMYAVMFLNVASSDHLMLSTMRAYMTLLMIAPMAVVMLLYMWGMYKNKKFNVFILVVSVIGFGVVFSMMRNQTGISDVQYMKAMIPHHSSAILTSENANLKDPETKKLAEDIIELQKEEIALMKAYLKRIEENN
ncbi:DUF305 domain-containing protein [Paucihalobacter ruber]|uniref:DUF305 domain-containing protein n=1 Tax=Paucihalobacter ruber TaxID=2567861 RepID=A0A506PTT1_9FLAO|nr:DUF305 domain-containing protein [Paucihalobacter ruber]TPV35640.1 DUF305 domain-containing protein [Paucihalobacter ruber]